MKTKLEETYQINTITPEGEKKFFKSEINKDRVMQIKTIFDTTSYLLGELYSKTNTKKLVRV